MALIKAMNNLCPEMHAVTKMADFTKLQPRRNFVRIVTFDKYHTLAPIILKRQKFDSSSLHDSFQLRKNLLS